FFQAEDGIRDFHVTGVQTCALPIYAIVVGSGAGGCMAGYILANAGLKVLMLEAGPFFDPAKDALQLRWPWESPRRGASTTRPFRSEERRVGEVGRSRCSQ